jgi:hypothetical protein
MTPWPAHSHSPVPPNNRFASTSSFLSSRPFRETSPSRTLALVPFPATAKGGNHRRRICCLLLFLPLTSFFLPSIFHILPYPDHIPTLTSLTCHNDRSSNVRPSFHFPISLLSLLSHNLKLTYSSLFRPGQEGPSFGPPPLPEGWIAQWDGMGRKYYFVQLATGTSQWETPTQPAPTGPTPQATPQEGLEHPYGTPGEGTKAGTEGGDGERGLGVSLYFQFCRVLGFGVV